MSDHATNDGERAEQIDQPAENLIAISFRAEAVLETDKPNFAILERGACDSPERRRKVYRRGDGWLDARVIYFDNLAPSQPIEGPAVIECDNTTIWLPPSASGELDAYGNLEIRTGGGS